MMRLPKKVTISGDHAQPPRVVASRMKSPTSSSIAREVRTVPLVRSYSRPALSDMIPKLVASSPRSTSRRTMGFSFQPSRVTLPTDVAPSGCPPPSPLRRYELTWFILGIHRCTISTLYGATGTSRRATALKSRTRTMEVQRPSSAQ